MMENADIGLIGLAVMGQNLVLNMCDHGFKVAVFNRTLSKVDLFVQGVAKNSHVIGTYSLIELVARLKRPRIVMILIHAGGGVDDIISELVSLLEEGDLIIDGGNSHYLDSERRCKSLEKKRMFFVGAGISGGEQGARYGPSIMVGGALEGWRIVKPILQSIAAKFEGEEPCCNYVGTRGAGHYVKMIHNGIEYGEMQMICEAYHILSSLCFSFDEIAHIFETWNKGKLGSYLIEITGKIFKHKDKDGTRLVENILDVAGQKESGKWMEIDAFDLGIPATVTGEAVFARFLSTFKEQRVKLSRFFPKENRSCIEDREGLVEEIYQALYAAKIICYVQGFILMQAAAKEMGWDLDYSSIAQIWRNGCIIRSALLGEIKRAFDNNRHLENLLLDDFFKDEILQMEKGWRRAVVHAAEYRIPIPCLSSALAFFDGCCSEKLPINLLQAQRDFFGAHTYERIDRPRGTFFHTHWGEQGS